MRNIAIAFVVVVLTGCTIEYHEGTYVTPAEKVFQEKALPVFEQACAACHWNPAWKESFLVGDSPAEVRDSVLASGVVNIENPVASQVLTKGVHSGPGLTAQQASDLLEWIVAERDEAQSP